MPKAMPVFLEKGLLKLEWKVGMTGEEVRLKQGAIRLSWSEGIFTFKHFGTTILVVDFRRGEKKAENVVVHWHMESATDARYIKAALDYWTVNMDNVDIGYGSVNGARFNVRNEDGKWEELKCVN